MDEVSSQHDALWNRLRTALVDTALTLLENDQNKALLFHDTYNGFRGFKIDESGKDIFVFSDNWKECLDYFNLEDMRDLGAFMISGDYKIVEYDHNIG